MPKTKKPAPFLSNPEFVLEEDESTRALFAKVADRKSARYTVSRFACALEPLAVHDLEALKASGRLQTILDEQAITPAVLVHIDVIRAALGEHTPGLEASYPRNTNDILQLNEELIKQNEELLSSLECAEKELKRNVTQAINDVRPHLEPIQSAINKCADSVERGGLSTKFYLAAKDEQTLLRAQVREQSIHNDALYKAHAQQTLELLALQRNLNLNARSRIKSDEDAARAIITTSEAPGWETPIWGKHNPHKGKGKASTWSASKGRTDQDNGWSTRHPGNTKPRDAPTRDNKPRSPSKDSSKSKERPRKKQISFSQPRPLQEVQRPS